MTSINNTLAERGARYGSFMDNASIAQAIKVALRSGTSWSLMAPDQRECLDMLAAKMSRIVTGDPQYLDNWHDVVGYATLVETRMREDESIGDAEIVVAAKRRTKARP